MLVSVRSAVAQDCYVIEAHYVQMSQGRHVHIFSLPSLQPSHWALCSEKAAGIRARNVS